jgi:hypothetical protein
MDFANLDTAELANEGAVMPVHGPDGQPVLQDDGSPVTLTLLGDDSDLLTKFDRITTNAHLRGSQTVTAELGETKQISRLARACVAWSGIVLEGKPLDHSEENAKALFRRFRWLRQQAVIFISDRANFLKASAQT